MKEQLKKDMSAVIRAYNQKGWSPATSTNYSFRTADNLLVIVVSRSGIDKANFTPNDFIEVDFDGEVLSEFEGSRPSAETLIHCVLYGLFPETMVVLHSHSVYPVLWSMELEENISFQGFEVQKGFDGQTSHDDTVTIPIFENSQDMVEFKSWMENRQEEINNHAFIIKGHGTYAWGKNLFEAKRHLETLDYLCELEWKRKKSI
ncbi:MAG: methylthioribulose 1-phosphate dehydratase [Crocinitomicaceae bacterium]